MDLHTEKLCMRRKFTSSVLTVLAFVFAITSSLSILQNDANAAPIVDFKPGRIIEDAVFTNSVSMNVSEIQSFLNSRVPNCDTNGSQQSEMNNYGVPDYNGNGSIQRWEWGQAKHGQSTFTCLKDFSEGGKTAAQIIYDASQQYAINPQVLIVLLQKEQGLVTDTWPLSIQYRSATGYGCPDTAACDSQYYGLTNQVKWAATMFRAILNNSPTWYTPYNLGNNYIRWNPNSSCGGSTVYIENRSTQALYNYTPYQPNQAALNAEYGLGDGCSAYGNRNFYLYFRDWFGYHAGPAAFKTSSSSTIYIPVEGYKMRVNQMATLQDYGISPDSIQTVSQAYVDSRPFPPVETGYSSTIGYVVKSPSDSDEDGGSVYLISRGKRYQFTSVPQILAYGFEESDIVYLPLGYIFAMKSGGTLSNFISSPYGSLFRIESDKKRIYFEYSTYISANPSDKVTPLSYYLADNIPSGQPITSRAVMIKQKTGETVRLYQNSTYYSIPNYETLSCWGFDASGYSVPTYRLPQNDYAESTVDSDSLSCAVSISTEDQLLTKTSRAILPGAISTSTKTLNSDLTALAERLPQKSRELYQYVKQPNSAAVWYINGSNREVIPSYMSFTLLGLNNTTIDTVNSSFLLSFSNAGIKLADGQLVKTPSSAAVYVISGNQRILYDSIYAFEAYKNKWTDIATLSDSDLNAKYAFNGGVVSTVLTNKTNDSVYIINSNKCYTVGTETLNHMGLTVSDLKTAQNYEHTAFPNINLSNCSSSATEFVKLPNSNLVYWLQSGEKHPLTTYSAMLSKSSGISPTVMTVDSSILSLIPTGDSYSQ